MDSMKPTSECAYLIAPVILRQMPQHLVDHLVALEVRGRRMIARLPRRDVVLALVLRDQIEFRLGQRPQLHPRPLPKPLVRQRQDVVRRERGSLAGAIQEAADEIQTGRIERIDKRRPVDRHDVQIRFAGVHKALEQRRTIHPLARRQNPVRLVRVRKGQPQFLQPSVPARISERKPLDALGPNHLQQIRPSEFGPVLTQ
jgi:hypothetical protein